MRIEVDDLQRDSVIALLQEHLANMHEWSPPESVHALDLARLRAPEITFWTAWEGPFGDYREDPNSVFMQLRLA